MGNSDSKETYSVFGACGTDPNSHLSFDETALPRGLRFSMKFLTREQLHFCRHLCELGQEHLFEEWDEMETEERLALVLQLMRVDEEMKQSGGLKKYLSTAQKLLNHANFDRNRRSMPLMNPTLKGWSPSVPAANEAYRIGSREYLEMEARGLHELARVGFCISATDTSAHLVAGGSKFNIPKFQLPVEMSTETSHIQHCIEFILHLTKKYTNRKGGPLPLCIMTSPETDRPIREFLEKNNFFGMDPTCIHLVSRCFGVPALESTDGRIALDPYDPSLALLQDRGHGDFHSLLYQSGIAQKWLHERGLKWLYMMEHETSALAFHTLPLMLSVSKERGLIMNTLAVPRKAKDDTIGAMCALKNRRSGVYKTASVEWNELDALLESKGYQEGETNDQKTGFSRFQGNTNQILFNLREYVDIMNDTRGQIPRVISPNYVDEEPEEDEDADKNAWGKRNSEDDTSCKNRSLINNKKDKKDKTDKNDRNKEDKKDGEKKSFGKEQDASAVLEFLEPVALETRIQDFVHLLSSEEELERVDFTMVTPGELAFSPIVNGVADLVDSTKEMRKVLELPPYCASTAEADQYGLHRWLLQSIGCNIQECPRTKYAGEVEVTPGPAIVFKPNFGFCLAELLKKFPNPEKVHISRRSTLVIRGCNVVIESLDLDGCLLIDCEDGQSLTVSDQVIRNAGWEQVRDPYSVQELSRMRGYSILRKKENAIEVVERKSSYSCSIM